MSFFLFPQLITATLESAINKLAKLDPSFTERCQPLVGKSLLVELSELKTPLLFVTTEQKIKVQAVSSEQAADCHLKTSLAALKELTDPTQITALIKQDRLELNGDITVAQQVSQLVKQTDIDWEEHLAYYIGDGAAHKIVYQVKSLFDKLQQKNLDVDRVLQQFSQDELKVSPPRQQLDKFSREVSETRNKVDKLAAKIANMSVGKS